MHKFIRNQELITTSLDDDLLMLDIDKGKYFSLNPVAARIWDLLEHEMSDLELTAQLLDEFDVSEKQCQDETNRALQEMLDLGLIHTTPA